MRIAWRDNIIMAVGYGLGAHLALPWWKCVLGAILWLSILVVVDLVFILIRLYFSKPPRAD